MLIRPPFARRPLLALLLLSPSLALAAEATKTATQFDAVTVTATRTEQTLDKVPNTVSVHTEREIDQQNINDIQDLVRYEPGVSVSGTGSRFGLSGFTIRGIGGNRVLTQVDGVSVPDAFNFGPFMDARRNYVDPDTVKQVEIIRGPASSLYGSDAIGGAVSFLTKDAADYLDEGDDAYARLKTGYDGADDSWLRSATLAGRQGSVDGVVHIGRRDGHALNTYGGRGGDGRAREEANPQDYEAQNLLLKGGWNYAGNDRLQLSYERFQDDADTNLRSDYPIVTPTGLGGGMFSNSLITASDAKDSTDRERVSLQNKFEVGSLLADNVDWQLNYQESQIRQQTMQTRYSWTAFNTNPTPPPTAYERFRTRDSRYEETLWSLNTKLDKQFALGETQHNLIYGVDLKRLESSDLRRGNEIRVSTGLPTPPAFGAETFPLSDFPDPVTHEYALFVQDSIEIGRWTLLPGLRYDYYQLNPHVTNEYLNAHPVDTSPSSFSDNALSPKLGVTYQLDDAHSVYGQYAAGFKAPEAVDIFGEFVNAGMQYQTIANTSLKAETSDSYEIGLRGQYDVGSFGVALFYNRYKDFIDQVTVPDPTGNNFLTYQQQNLSKVTIRGAEAKGELFLDRFGLPAGTRALGSIAYARGKNEETGAPLNSVDPLKAVLGLGYTAPSGRFGGDLAWTLVSAKERVDQSQNAAIRINEQFETPGYGLLDLNGWWQVTEEFSVNAGVFNLADKKYWQWGDVQGLDSNSVSLGRYTQPGRHAAVNLVWEI
ncbi:TonB-dependent hemoglobin/transferrin/lactoferrin family receptor [Pseudomonas sp. UL073]|uniref:TonB-dependent hemoglobin/transferrin/lactoferrin family receptor n=1 Tax=Zestomonas insulae TaxID=2809017 RepID=A0ABS2IJ96_9GAMM|nr:TonB-dependent hemoglobin/transferrin/lactoferrin family receptor [Pseudomonas insulae]MBM7063136.1 TonB-dependent hemoglobin/transferrin/lactoferrin family receptor [Pseudomonas insulae]